MNILVSGSTGLIGSALIPSLQGAGHHVTRLVRGAARPGQSACSWDPQRGPADPRSLEQLDAVVHLAGESIVGRWTAEKRRRIRDSRVDATRRLCEALSRLASRPKAFVCASAVGYYGDRGDEELTEASGRGQGFLPDVCEAWEAAAAPLAARGTRVVNLRFGMVLSPVGGALAKMLPIFRVGLGGPVGNGRQWWSWVTLDDAVGAITHALDRPDVAGPVNTVAPQPVTNKTFTAALARALRRPAIFPLPAPIARLMFGEMADALLLASAKVVPSKLLATNYKFVDDRLDGALQRLLRSR